MKVLLYAMYPPTPLLEIGLEIICNHLEKGDDVYVLQCTGQLRTCPDNWLHKKSWCILCRSKHRHGFEKIGLSRKHIITLPKDEPSYKKIPKVFNNIDELKSFTYDGLDLGRGVSSSLISEIRDHKPDTIKYRKRIYDELKVNYYVYTSVLKQLDKIKPDIFYAFNGRTSTIMPAIRACRKKGLTFYTYDVAFTTDRYFLSKNDVVQSSKNIQREIMDLWNDVEEDKEQIGAQFFINNRELKQENMHFLFVKNQQISALPLGFDRTKRNIVIFNSSMDEFEALEDWENPIYEDQNEGIKRILESFKNEPNIKFYLRVHPNLKGREDNSQMRETKEITSLFENVEVIPPESPIHTYSLMDACNITITFGSTVGVEACFWNKPSILLGRSFYEFLDCCYKPDTHEEVIDMIKGDLAPKDKLEALKYGYWALRQGIPFKRFVHTHLYDPFNSPHRGKFLGEEINYSDFAYRLYQLRMFFEIKSYPFLLKLFKRKLNVLVNKVSRRTGTIMNRNYEKLEKFHGK